MKAAKRLVELILILIALGAALYIQRGPILEWYQEATTPALPEAVGYGEVSGGAGSGLKAGEVEEVQEVKEVEVEEAVEEEVQEVEEVKEEAEEVQGEEEEIEEVALLPDSVNLAVPFTPQAPHGNWEYPYKEACEEASVYMVHRYYEGEPEGRIDPDKADLELLQIVEFQRELFGYYEDTNVEQTAIFAELMFGFSDVTFIKNPTVEQIKQELAAGRPVIVPAAGRLLGNPYFTPPGPVYHMLVVRGYTESGQFITNDPGTKRGEAYLYEYDTLMNAIHDFHANEITEGQKIVFVLSP